jgi:hypothetical protein
MATPTWCRKKAAEFGPYTETLVTAILKENTMRNLRKAQKTLLRFTEEQLDDIDGIAQRACDYGVTRYKAIKAMLEMEVPGDHFIDYLIA